MLSPTQETRTNDEEVVPTNILEDDHVSPDRSIVGPYTVDMPDPRD